MEKTVEYYGKPLEYWKENANEDYMITPISVLKYITMLEEAPIKSSELQSDNKALSDMCDKLAEALRDSINDKLPIELGVELLADYNKLKGGKDE